MDKKSLHWSAVVAVACSSWLLFWLFCIAAALYDLAFYDPNQVEDVGTKGIKDFMIIVVVLALWAGYRGIKRLAFLRYGESRDAKVVKGTRDGDNYDGHGARKETYYTYSFKLKGHKYSNEPWPWHARGLKNRSQVEIVYDTRKPDKNFIASKFRVRFDSSSNQWRSSMWHVIPRLILLVAVVVAILVLLFMYTF